MGDRERRVEPFAEPTAEKSRHWDEPDASNRDAHHDADREIELPQRIGT